jgi:outer membrane protease
MKNITALAVLVIIIDAFFANISLYGQEQKKERSYSFSIAPQFGIASGQTREIVFPTDTKNEYLSELIWEMNPVLYYGTQLEFGLIDPMKRPGFFFSLSAKFGIPGKTGTMEDRDWRSTENSNLTDFSSHTNETRGFYWLDAVAGASLPIKSLFFVKPFISASYMHFSFAAKDGYAKYARKKPNYSNTYFSIDDNPNTPSFSGDVILYTQDWFVIAAGIGLNYRFNRAFSFDLSFQISPFTFCNDQDEHLLTYTTYKDYTRFGIFIEPQGELAFTPVKWLEICMDISYRYIGETKGESYYLKTAGDNDYLLEANQAGTSLSLLHSSLMFKIRF